MPEEKEGITMFKAIVHPKEDGNAVVEYQVSDLAADNTTYHQVVELLDQAANLLLHSTTIGDVPPVTGRQPN